ncbi:MAG: dihydrolipoyl dehydrogenase, partial [Candidatus Thorarchaeota archaeon]
AIGDVTGGLMLAHIAYHEADVAVANALASIGDFPVKETRTDYNVVPATIFTTPNIGSIGMRRKAAKDRGINVLMGQFPYKSLGKAKCMGKTEGFLMTLAEKKDLRIIGASCIGAEAPELIAEIALAIQNNLTIHDVIKTIHSHPTISEMVLEACEATIGKAIHKKGKPDHR